MPIPGLLSQEPTFPKIGDIRKGAKKTQADRPGPDLTYFRYAPIEGEEEAEAQFHAIYGDEPREINIFLPFDTIERNFEAFMERHTSGALQCRGSIEGDVCYLWRDGDDRMHREQKPCPSPPCEGCKETGRLKVIIPELRRLAYVTVHTTSKWDIIELRSNLKALRKLTGNGLKGIPLVLKRRPRQVPVPINGKRVRKEMWLLSIEADPRYVDAQLKAMEAAALPSAGGEVPTLTARVVDAETGEVIDEIEEVEGEWDDATFAAGEDADAVEPEPEEAEAQPATETPPEVQAAMDFKTKSGRTLGAMEPQQLRSAVEQIDGLNHPSEYMREMRGHCVTLLQYLEQFEQQPQEQQELAL